MARLGDVHKVIRSVGVWGFFKRVWVEIGEDGLFTWAAALSYSWLFAVFPFMLFLLTLLPYLPEIQKEKARVEIRASIYQLLPSREAADTIWQNVDQSLQSVLSEQKSKTAYRWIGLGLSLWAASGGMAMTMAALDACYEMKTSRRFVKHRVMAITLTIVVAALIASIVVLLPIGTIAKHWVEHRGLVPKSSLIAFDLARWPLALVFMITVLALVYYYGPTVKHKFQWITPGGVFCLLVWIILGFGFRIYVNRFGHYDKTYGSVGGVAVLLLFFYVDALVLLVGAEINSEIDFEVLNVRRGQKDLTKAEEAEEAQDALKAAKPPEPASGSHDAT